MEFPDLAALESAPLQRDPSDFVVTVLMYFNPKWTQPGRKLRLLRSAADIENFAQDVTPLGGTLLAFRRGDRSFHGCKQFDGEPRIVLLNWVKPNKFAWYAEQWARLGTHSAIPLSR